MISLTLVVILLAAVASYGSWQLAQYIGARQRTSSSMLVLFGMSLLAVLVVVAVVSATSWWKRPAVEVAESAAPIGSLAARRASEPVEQAVPSIAEPDPLMADWPATYCLKSSHAQTDDAGQAYVDNECGRLVAVIYSWCQLSHVTCSEDRPDSLHWRYEPAGVLLTTVAQRPSTLRLSEDGPLVASTYVLSEPGDQRRRVRFIACYVTAHGVLEALGADGVSLQDQSRALHAALSSDACYSRVMKFSHAGRIEGKPIDALLRAGL